MGREQDVELAQASTHRAWPAHLQRLGAIRFARRSHHFAAAVHFYREVIGLPLYERFEGSYGSTGAIFALPGPSLTLELVESATPVTVDPHEQLCLYFADPAAMDAVRRRLVAAGLSPVLSHPYWVATGAVTYQDPDGREVVLAPFTYGNHESAASFADGVHTFPDGAE